MPQLEGLPSRHVAFAAVMMGAQWYGVDVGWTHTGPAAGPVANVVGFNATLAVRTAGAAG